MASSWPPERSSIAHFQWNGVLVVRSASEGSCKEFVFHASEELHRLGLNINVAKVKLCPKSEFDGRKTTALKRAVTLASRLKGTEARTWRNWVRETASQEKLALQLSREQLLAYVQLYDDPVAAWSEVMPLFLDQPFSQPKTILLRALRGHGREESVRLRDLWQTTVEAIGKVQDPVLDLCLAAYGSN